MGALLTRLLLAVVVLLAGTQALVPPFLAARVAESLETSLGGVPVQVRLDTFPALRLLTGHVDRLTVDVADMVVDGLAVESLRLEAVDVRMDVPGVLRGEAWRPQADDNVTVQAVVQEAAVARLVRERLPVGVDVDVRLTTDGVELFGRTQLLGMSVDLTVRGRVAPDETGTQLVFVPEEIVVGGQALADWIAAGLRQTYTASVDLDASPVPLVVEEVVHGPGRITITGRPRSAG